MFNILFQEMMLVFKINIYKMKETISTIQLIKIVMLIYTKLKTLELMKMYSMMKSKLQNIPKLQHITDLN